MLKIIFHLNSNLTKCSSLLFAKFGDLTNNLPTEWLRKEPPLLLLVGTSRGCHQSSVT